MVAWWVIRALARLISVGCEVWGLRGNHGELMDGLELPDILYLW